MPRRKKTEAEKPLDEQFVRITDTSGASDRELALLARAERAERERDAALGKARLTEQELADLRATASQASVIGAQEIPTGRQVEITRAVKLKVAGRGDQGRPILEEVSEPRMVDSYLYRINMAPCGDLCLRINNIEFYHGVEYEVDIFTLRTLKDMVARTWDHDRSIHQSDENFYRRDAGWNARNARARSRGIM